MDVGFTGWMTKKIWEKNEICLSSLLENEVFDILLTTSSNDITKKGTLRTWNGLFVALPLSSLLQIALPSLFLSQSHSRHSISLCYTNRIKRLIKQEKLWSVSKKKKKQGTLKWHWSRRRVKKNKI